MLTGVDPGGSSEGPVCLVGLPWCLNHRGVDRVQVPSTTRHGRGQISLMTSGDLVSPVPCLIYYGFIIMICVLSSLSHVSAIVINLYIPCILLHSGEKVF